MPDRAGKKMLTVWIDQEDQEALQTLCRNHSTSVSSALRNWILTAIQQKTTDLVAASSDTASGETTTRIVDAATTKLLNQRVSDLEEQLPKFHRDDLDEMHREVLSGEFGSLRYRLGIVEAQLQSLGGSIAWDNSQAAD